MGKALKTTLHYALKLASLRQNLTYSLRKGSQPLFFKTRFLRKALPFQGKAFIFEVI